VTKSFDMEAALALATSTAVDKMAPKSAPPKNAAEPLVALNFRIRASCHKKLKTSALAWDMTMTELLESFIETLPDVQSPDTLGPVATWNKAKA
jgi:hypothetical protein